MKTSALTARVIGFLMALALSVAALAATLNALGTSPELMLSQMQRYAPSASTGLPEDEYPGMALMITGYLDGQVASFQYELASGPAFHDYEQTHMRDCLALFRLDRTVLLWSVIALTVLCVCAFLMHDARRIAQGVLAGTGLVAAAVAVVGIIGAADFDRLFILFHQLSFDNSLWLLNPATDLLIRLMPTAFFMSYALIGLITWLLALTLTGAIALAVCRYTRRKIHTR